MSDADNKQVALSSDHGVSLNTGFLSIATLEDALKVSKIIANSGLCPKNYEKKPDDVLVAMQMGAELGLKPMQALQNIAVINGRPSVWGDAMLAICRQSSQFESITERYTASPEPTYTCVVKRKNEPEFISTFSEADARKAGLWTKPGVWQQYPKRMLQMRARGFALRDSFPDLLRGLLTREEADDYPRDRAEHVVTGQVVDSVVEGVAEPAIERITSEQLEILQLKIDESKTDVEVMCKHYGVAKIEDFTPSQWPNIIRVLDKKIKQAAQADALAAMADSKTTPDTTVSDYFAEADKVDTTTGEVIE